VDNFVDNGKLDRAGGLRYVNKSMQKGKFEKNFLFVFKHLQFSSQWNPNVLSLALRCA
jgi:hypothetical protein